MSLMIAVVGGAIMLCSSSSIATGLLRSGGTQTESNSAIPSGTIPSGAN